jgi:hypothetical protein
MRWPVVLLLFALGAPAAADAAASNAGISLSFDSDAPPRPTTIRGPRGLAYVLELAPQRDADERLIGVDLYMSPVGRRCCNDLLAPSGHWHGLQPFMFMGWDLQDGGRHPLLGVTRRIPMHGVRAAAEVTVVSAEAVHDRDEPPCCVLKRLQLRVRIVPR